MALPPDPPPPDWPSQEFSDAKSLAANGYDASHKSFKDAGGTPYFLITGMKGAVGTLAWYVRKIEDVGACPLAELTSDTFAIVRDGSLNQDGSITVGTKTYMLLLERDAGTNAPVAVAKRVS